MSTTTKTVMWAVYDPDGEVLISTLHIYSDQSKRLYTGGGFLHSTLWSEAEKYGYTCRPVRVTIEEIKKEKR